DEDGAADKIDAELRLDADGELANLNRCVLGVIPVGNADDQNPEKDRRQTQHQSFFEWFHVREERLSCIGRLRLCKAASGKSCWGQITCPLPLLPWPSLPWSGCARCCRVSSAISRCRPP